MPITHAPTPDTRRLRATIILLVAVLALLHLGWQWTHGGIVSHHLLANPALPAVSNGWGIIALPALAWVLSGSFLRRATSRPAARAILIAAFAGAAAGTALSLAFSLGSTDHATLVLLAILLAGLAWPVYRAEYLLGFVLAMSWVFGPILPILVGAVVALASFVVRRIAWPAIAWTASRLRA